MSKTQNDYLETLAYLQGETTVNTSNNRKKFIQNSLKDVYRAYPWPWNQEVNNAITLASGIAALPTDFARFHPLTVRYAVNADSYTEIEIEDQDSTTEGDRSFWVTADGDGTYSLNSKEPDQVLTIIYQKLAPTLTASNSSLYDNDQVVAYGARRYLKLADDPNADISQDDALFEKELQKDIASYQVNVPRRYVRTLQSMGGYYTGQTSGDSDPVT